MRARRARPRAVNLVALNVPSRSFRAVTGTRAPTRVARRCVCTVRTRPAFDATTSACRRACFATTMPWKVAAPAVAGNAMPMPTTRERISFFIWRSPFCTSGVCDWFSTDRVGAKNLRQSLVRVPLGGQGDTREGAAELHEQRFQGERRVHVELGEVAPRLARQLGRLLRAAQSFER